MDGLRRPVLVASALLLVLWLILLPGIGRLGVQVDLLALYGSFAEHPPGPERSLLVVAEPLDEAGRARLAERLEGVPGVLGARVPSGELPDLPADWAERVGDLLRSPGDRTLAEVTVRAGDRAVLDDLERTLPEVELVGSARLDRAHAEASASVQRRLGVVLLPGLLFLLAWVLRSGRQALVVLGSVGVGTSMLAGLMGWLGVSLGGPNVLLLPLVIVLGVADGLHLYGRLPGRTPLQALRAVLLPCGLTSLTTGLAFLALGTSPVEAVRTFGLLAALGMGLALLAGLLLPTSVLLLARSEVPVPRGRGGVDRLRRVPLGMVGLLACLALFGASRARTDLVLGGELPVDDPTLLGLQRLDVELDGVFPAVIRLETGRPGGALEVDAARRLLRVQTVLDTDPAVGWHRSWVDVLRLGLGDRPGRGLHGPLGGIRYRPVRERGLDLAERSPLPLFDEDRSAFLVHVRFRDVGARAWARVLDRLGALDLGVQTDGHVALAVRAWRAVLPELTRVLLVTLASVLLVVVAWTRSWRGALGAAGVVTVSTASTLAMLVLLGQPLNHANVFVVALAIGLATDGWIHLAGPGAELEEVGPALVGTATVLGGGFLLLATAPLPSLRAIGLSLAASTALNVLVTVALGRWLSGGSPSVPGSSGRSGHPR